MKTAIKNIKYIITVILFTTSCQLSEDLMDAMNEYNTDAMLTVTVSPGAAAFYNNDAMVVTLTPSEPEFTIKYTTDGSDPSRTAGTEYTAPFPIDTASGFTAGSTIEIRVVAYDENRISNVVSRTVVLGDGLTAATSYEIATALQLATAATRVNSGVNAAASFRQVADIDLSGYSAGIGWTPIGVSPNNFTGTYNGGNFTISNLTINSPTNNQGLFGNVAGNASLQNITLSDVNITGWGSTGALAGDVNGTGITVNNCDVTGTSQVFGVTSIGGLIGNCNNATITDCSITATVTGTTDYTGGLAGYISSTDVTGCNTDVTVTGKNYIGGLIGYAERTVLKTILRCTSAGTVTGENGVGGLVGITGRDATNKGVLIDDSLSAASVEGTALLTATLPNPIGVGGLVGALLYGGEITNSRAYGDVTNAANPGETRETGGLVGAIVYSGSTVTGSYAEGNVSAPNALRVGGFAGFNQTTAIIGNNNHSTGNVTGYDNVGGFVGYNNSSILSGNYATGTVTGHTVVGGFSGWNAGYITGCYAIGTITGTGSSIGGFSGNNFGAGANITDCYARGNVQSSGSFYGGFIGTNTSGTITNCYSTGILSGTGSNVGGFVGNNSAGTYFSCYWLKDIPLSLNNSIVFDDGNNTDIGTVYDRTRTQMYASGTYTGWDFSVIWDISEGIAYPFFR